MTRGLVPGHLERPSLELVEPLVQQTQEGTMLVGKPVGCSAAAAVALPSAPAQWLEVGRLTPSQGVESLHPVVGAIHLAATHLVPFCRWGSQHL